MQKSYYAIIPANVRYDKELTPNAKLLYGEITALCNERGYCWASNSYFSELYKVSIRSVSKWINQLIEKKYITSELIFEEGKKEVKERHLRIGAGIEEKFHTSGIKVQDPIEEKFQDNNTVINTTTNKGYEEEFNQFWNVYPKKLNKKPAFEKFKSARKKHSFETIIDGTKKYIEYKKKTGKADYIQHPTTFLNQESYIDGFEEIGKQPNQPIIEQPKETVLSQFWE